MKKIRLQHLIDVTQLNKEDIKRIFSRAEFFLDKPISKEFSGKKLINLFFETSTRSRTSFEIAAKNLGMEVINIDISTLALHKKGESEKDTILTLNALKPDFITIRHQYGGIVEKLSQYSENASIINAGDGSHAHPTQALLDAFTIYKAFKMKDLAGFKKIKLVIAGDIINSRVARSNIKLLSYLGVDITLASIPTLLPKYWLNGNIKITTNIKEAVKNTDIIMILRLQRERMENCFVTSFADYYKFCGINEEILQSCNKKPVIMHPGPINREVELASSIADNKDISLILHQVTNGIAVRQAVLEKLSH
jgi:aspartate carbamoyltransferase catalytic subunit